MSVNRASEVWNEIKPFALKDLAMLKNDAKSGSNSSGYFIILYDESAEKLRYYSASADGYGAALAAAESGDIIWLPAGIITLNQDTYYPGSEIDNGAIPVTVATGVQISGLTIGKWYSIESTGGPWSNKYYNLPENPFHNIRYFDVSNDELNWYGGPVHYYDGMVFPNMVLPPWAAFMECSEFENSDIQQRNNRIYFKATTTSIWIRVSDYLLFSDNTGSLSWKLRFANVAVQMTIPSGVEVAGMGGNCVIDGNIENNGLLTNVIVNGEISGTGSYHAFDSNSAWETNKQIKSDLAEGISPFEIASRTLNVNLNADLLDGKHASELQGAVDFTDLGDVPASYTGQGGKNIRVKSDASGLEFVTPSSGDGDVIQDGEIEAGHIAVFSADHHIEDGGPPSGETPSPISSLSDSLLIWWCADSIIGAADGDPLEFLPDKSRHGFDIYQGNSSYRPTFYSTAMNGFPTLRFGMKSLASGMALPNGSGTLCAIHKMPSGSLVEPMPVAFGRSGTIGGANKLKALYSANAKFGVAAWGSELVSDTLIPRDVPNLWTATWTSMANRSVQIFNDQTNVYSSSYNWAAIGSIEGVWLGGLEDKGQYQYPGDIAEVLYFNRILSAEELSLVFDYFGKYGI